MEIQPGLGQGEPEPGEQALLCSALFQNRWVGKAPGHEIADPAVITVFFAIFGSDAV
jgi:hypothetical protein